MDLKQEDQNKNQSRQDKIVVRVVAQSFRSLKVIMETEEVDSTPINFMLELFLGLPVVFIPF